MSVLVATSDPGQSLKSESLMCLVLVATSGSAHSLKPEKAVIQTLSVSVVVVTAKI